MSIFIIFSIVFSVITTPIPSQVDAKIPRIEISPKKSLLDRELIIQLFGLQPDEMIQIQAQTKDSKGIQWSSYGVFQANSLGEIDLSKQPPLEGSYEGIDSMGLLWSMQPKSKKVTFFKTRQEQFPVIFKVFRENQEIASKKIFRLRKIPNIKKILVKEDGLIGALFLPASKKPLPVIITLNGSNGGLGEHRAKLLASHGFAVLGLGYFGVKGLPPNLENIPLEYFETAFAWIKKHPAINASRIGLYGVSRGGELALLLGTLFPKSIQALVAVVPSSVLYGSLRNPSANAWLYQGKPLAPCIPIQQIRNNGKDPSHPIHTRENFLKSMENKKAFEAAAIPVEKIQAPLLIISAGDDQMWPSELYATQIQQRLQTKNSSIICKSIHYPKAGHGIGIPNLPQANLLYYHPTTKRWFMMGGTIAENQWASQDSWEKILTFFQEFLQGLDIAV